MEIYLSRDKDGTLYMSQKKPIKNEETGMWIAEGLKPEDDVVEIIDVSVDEDLYKKLLENVTWNSEPVKLDFP